MKETKVVETFQKTMLMGGDVMEPSRKDIKVDKINELDLQLMKRKLVRHRKSFAPPKPAPKTMLIAYSDEFILKETLESQQNLDDF
mmetsp:Transcript_19355/g.37497  ORF Transcript_19355/g.37497 Transcript_19355/m.37497 type:complete len:86 (-) Transcript_19355:254-511(-)